MLLELHAPILQIIFDYSDLGSKFNLRKTCKEFSKFQINAKYSIPREVVMQILNLYDNMQTPGLASCFTNSPVFTTSREPIMCICGPEIEFMVPKTHTDYSIHTPERKCLHKEYLKVGIGNVDIGVMFPGVPTSWSPNNSGRKDFADPGVPTSWSPNNSGRKDFADPGDALTFYSK